MNKMMICAMVCAAVRLSFAEYEVQNWAASPASGVWSTSAANWEGGVPWTQYNAAAFGDSTVKDVTVGEKVYVHGLSFSVDGYRIAGTGPVEGDGATGANDVLEVTADSGITAELAVPIMLKNTADLRKRGSGEIMFSTDQEIFRVTVYDGLLTFKDAKITTAKFQIPSKEAEQTDTAKLCFDGATILPYNANTTLGAEGAAFPDGNVTVGAGGLSVMTDPKHSGVTWMRIAQKLDSAEGLAAAGDGGFTMNGNFNLYLDMSQTTLTGGFRFLKGSTYLKYAEALGTGPVTLDANLYATNTMVIPNRIAFGENGVLGVAAGAGRLTVSNVGFTADNTVRLVKLASQNGSGEIRIAAGEDPIAASGISLSGGIGLAVDGAVLKASSNTTEFIVDESGTGNPVAVASCGFVFDTDGHDVWLGRTLDFPIETEIRDLGSRDFANFSFESASLENWSQEPGRNGSCAAFAKTSAFTENYQEWKDTCLGDYYAVLRSSSMEKTASISQSFSVDSDGEWTVEFLYATRPNYYTGQGVALAVYLDKGTQNEIALRGMAADGRQHAFELWKCAPVALKAGETHTLTFVSGLSAYPEGSPYIGNDAILIDAVRVSGSLEVERPQGALSKTGAGSLLVPSLAGAGGINVSEGVLSLAGASFSKDSVVNVAAGATLALSFAAAIPNANFEEDIGEKELRKDKVVSGWTLAPIIGTADLGGTQGDGSAFSLNGPLTTEGNHNHTAFLRPQNFLETGNVSVPRTGDYILSFEYARRAGSSYDTKEMNISVKLDGAMVAGVPFAETSSSAFVRKSCRVTLSAGTHVLRFEVDGNSADNGPCMFIDAVRLDAADPDFADNGAIWNFARGATLDIGAFDVRLGNVFVDGQKINGGRSALKAAGVTVVGTGRIHVGDDLGLMLIFR